MTQRKNHRLWIAGVAILLFCSFLSGTTLACLQKSGSPMAMAEDCCQGRCQHAMVGDLATTCCQSHQTKVAQALPTTPAVKAVGFASSTVHSALISPVVLQDPTHFWALPPAGERSPSSPPIYTLHCAFLI